MDSYINIRINGKSLENKNEIKKALLKISEDLEKNPGDEATIVSKSVLLYKLQEFKESLKCLNQIENVKTAPLLELKAIIFMGLKNYKEALTLINEVLKLDSNKISALYYKSECLFQLKRFKEVVDIADFGLKIDSKHQPLLVNKFCSLVELNRIKEATEVKEKLLRLSQDYNEWG